MKTNKILAILLSAGMLFSLAACGGGSTTESTETTESSAAAESTAAAESEAGEESSAEEPEPIDINSPLVAACSEMSGRFSPFFAESDADLDAQNMTQLALLTRDRSGAVICRGIEGESASYNGTEYTYYGPADLVITENGDGTVSYAITLRDDLVFSDGEPVTIDDVIFSIYVRSDPTYNGPGALTSLPIVGMEEYLGSMEPLIDLLIAAGPDNTDFTHWDESVQAQFWADADAAGIALVNEICGYLKSIGFNAPDDTVAACAANWEYELAADATEADFWAAIKAHYPDPVTAIKNEAIATGFEGLMPNYERYLTAVRGGSAADHISGIQKTGEYSLCMTASRKDADMLEKLAIAIAPMHYYGDPALYDYDSSRFGFEKGDLSAVRAKTAEPMGAGPYIFRGFENGVISYEANPNYYRGEPKIKYVNFVEMSDADALNGVIAGTVDIAELAFSTETAARIREANDGELTGDVVTTRFADRSGYGCIGINAKNVCVAGDAGSEASRNLRKAFGTIFSAYRDASIRAYYGDSSAVINYPISRTSWAAPQPADDSYMTAFSVDASGNALYTDGMRDDERYAAARSGALSFLAAAGYTIADGKAAEAPEGASLSYEIFIKAGSSGDHPAFDLLTLARDAFSEIGINLVITRFTRDTDLLDALDEGSVEMWCGDWETTVVPDMYTMYYSDAANNYAQPGSFWHYYQITDTRLDELILASRASADQAAGKAMYRESLDIIADWGDVIPLQQEQNLNLFNTKKISTDTAAADPTVFYGWMDEIADIAYN